MQYLVSLSVPPLLLLFIGRFTRQRWSLVHLTIASVVFTYAVVVASAFALSAWYGYQAESYDVNHDGIISLEEQSPAQANAESLAINDAGRNLSVILALPWALLLSVSFFGVVSAIRWLSKRREPAALATLSAPRTRVVSNEPDA